jgi:hypothetical protein
MKNKPQTTALITISFEVECTPPDADLRAAILNELGFAARHLLKAFELSKQHLKTEKPKEPGT